MVKRKSHKRKSHKRRSHKRRNMSIRSKKGAYSSLSSGFNNLKQYAASFQNAPVKQMGAGKQTKKR